jgi:alkylation response protein AidB-like acyl-CoA dehydrogenase
MSVGVRVMDFRFSDEQELFRKTVSEFVDKNVIPIAQKIDEEDAFPTELFKKIADMGYFGLRYPEEYGGSGADNTTFCIFCEEMARGSMTVAAISAMQSLMGTNFIFRFGSEELKEKLLKPAIKGEKIGTIAMTEPGAGSDLGSIETTAKLEGDNWVLNGRKTWITNATVADFFSVLASTDRSKGMKGVNFFLVEKGTEGFEVGRKIEKLGVKGTATTELGFNDCRIPKENLLGIEGKGQEQLLSILGEIRTMTGALSIGLARAALDDSIRYSNERIQFGKPIGKYQAIRIKLANMGTELEAAKLLVYYASWLVDKKMPFMKETAMAKLYASEMAIRAVDEAFRVHASYGFARDLPIQRYMRDARFLLIGGGTSEILQMIIAKELGV